MARKALQSMMICLILVVFGFTSQGFAQTGESSAKQADPAQPDGQEAASVPEDDGQSTLEMLEAIVRMKADLKTRMAEKKRLMKKADSETEKKQLETEIAELDKNLAGANLDFERIATGVDVGRFTQKKAEPFNWKDEVVSLVEPGIVELKRMTVKARQKARLRDELGSYQELVPVATKARERIESLVTQVKDPELKKEIKELLPEYKGVESQITNKLNLIRLQLEDMERAETSLIESTGESVKRFFKTRGMFLFIAVIVCIAVVLILRLAYRFIIRMIPGYNAAYRPFHIRVVQLLYRVSTVLFTLLAVIMVFYLFEDWVLLSLAIILLLGVAWAAKNTLPGFVHQSRLMLNIGAVREGERMMYEGVPWLVRQINLHSTLENPDLGIKLRLPIEALMDKTSRPFQASESWFPCRKNDWVILSDGVRGCVTSLSHEMVELVQRGGARKTYQTGDFLSLSPLNLSMNFRLKVLFGISYNLQASATGQVPGQLSAHIEAQIEAEGYKEDLLNLRVEFANAGASSLDLVVIADFTGKMAPLYNRLNRAIQRWCVDAATRYGWEIPFPQLTVHRQD